jgi:hypothetical protein
LFVVCVFVGYPVRRDSYSLIIQSDAYFFLR